MKIKEYDIWYEPCTKCGYDTGKSNKKSPCYCWKCGNQIYRDYSDRALKANRNNHEYTKRTTH